MVVLSDIFDGELYRQMVAERYVRTQTHPTLPLMIANYSEIAQFARMWNDVTLNCRGLIFNVETEEVIARGFRKFFNFDDNTVPYPPTGPCLRMPKMDGSLGILYRSGDQWAVATRGSFTSDQALWATRWLQTSAFVEQAQKITPWRYDRSYLFEIIYPDNRIVVDYHGDERLVLLDVLDTATGKSDLDEFDRILYLDKVAKQPLLGFQDTMASEIPEGEEGFVFYWPDKDFRTKMKSADYLALHKMIFSLSERSVWARLGEGESVEDICVKLPDEFHDWVKDVANRLEDSMADIMTNIIQEFNRIIRVYQMQQLSIGHFDAMGSYPPRKDFAESVKGSPYKAYMFMMYDDKDIGDEVWRSLRPAGNLGVKTISEDVA